MDEGACKLLRHSLHPPSRIQSPSEWCWVQWGLALITDPSDGPVNTRSLGYLYMYLLMKNNFA